MMSKRTRTLVMMLSVAGATATIATTSSYAAEATAPGHQQRNEGAGVRGGQSAQSGQGASPQGGQGAATQMGTPPAQLKREEEARQRGHASGAAAK
ncbi:MULTISPECIES: hypothetical protein [unclassified Caballeronia]|uniref:hypothetical protein n=1 Tax=unclassified Caballeronia TaxID=2646786 RepID=UPI002854571D|nr:MULTISPECIES: hypothetical protein [unclassified Caballeronia]MDR5740477.1 hypothetical protein [Caballeronia sp. LZ016]MDR5809002.1 hypothetical protein [Caballeronia sp. LZ019]